MPLDRDTVVTCRMSKDERAMLEEIAEADGLSASDVLRQLVRREHAKRFDAVKKGGRKS